MTCPGPAAAAPWPAPAPTVSELAELPGVMENGAGGLPHATGGGGGCGLPAVERSLVDCEPGEEGGNDAADRPDVEPMGECGTAAAKCGTECCWWLYRAVGAVGRTGAAEAEDDDEAALDFECMKAWNAAAPVISSSSSSSSDIASSCARCPDIACRLDGGWAAPYVALPTRPLPAAVPRVRCCGAALVDPRLSGETLRG